MSDFWKSYDITALEYGEGYQCYPLYGKIHRIELALSLLFIVGVALWYKRSGASCAGRSWSVSQVCFYWMKLLCCWAWP